MVFGVRGALIGFQSLSRLAQAFGLCSGRALVCRKSCTFIGERFACAFLPGLWQRESMAKLMSDLTAQWTLFTATVLEIWTRCEPLSHTWAFQLFNNIGTLRFGTCIWEWWRWISALALGESNIYLWKHVVCASTPLFHMRNKQCHATCVNITIILCAWNNIHNWELCSRRARVLRAVDGHAKHCTECHVVLWQKPTSKHEKCKRTHTHMLTVETVQTEQQCTMHSLAIRARRTQTRLAHGMPTASCVPNAFRHSSLSSSRSITDMYANTRQQPGMFGRADVLRLYRILMLTPRTSDLLDMHIVRQKCWYRSWLSFQSESIADGIGTTFGHVISNTVPMI